MFKEFESKRAFKGDCNDRDYQIYLAGIHSISEWNFTAWIRNYDPNLIGGKSFPAAEIIRRLNGHSCATQIIKVNPEEGEGQPGTNGDIIFELVHADHINYSIGLFKGILELLEPEEIQFFKARKYEGDFDIIFKVIKNGSTVYFGDVSDSQP